MFRSVLVAMLAAVLLPLFALLVWVTDQPNEATATLVLTALAAGAFISFPSGHPGVLGHPLISRITPPIVGFATLCFIMWLGSQESYIVPGQVPGLDAGTTSFDIANSIWRFLKNWAGAFIALLAMAYGFYTLRVYRRTAAAFRDRRSEEHLSCPDFY